MTRKPYVKENVKDMGEIYVACIEAEGGQAAFSTLEKAIEWGGDYVAKWKVDGEGLYDAEVVWSRPLPSIKEQLRR
jgi:hypothetical protein